MVFTSTLFAQTPKRLAAKENIRHHKMFKGLNLTEEQKSKMVDLRLAHQKKMLPLQTELRGKMTEIRLLKTEENPNLNRIDQMIEQAEKIRTKIQKARTRHQLEIRKMLTPDQKKLWDSRVLQGLGPRMMGRKFRSEPAIF